MVYYY